MKNYILALVSFRGQFHEIVNPRVKMGFFTKYIYTTTSRKDLSVLIKDLSQRISVSIDYNDVMKKWNILTMILVVALVLQFIIRLRFPKHVALIIMKHVALIIIKRWKEQKQVVKKQKATTYTDACYFSMHIGRK